MRKERMKSWRPRHVVTSCKLRKYLRDRSVKLCFSTLFCVGWSSFIYQSSTGGPFQCGSSISPTETWFLLIRSEGPLPSLSWAQWSILGELLCSAKYAENPPGARNYSSEGLPSDLRVRQIWKSAEHTRNRTSKCICFIDNFFGWVFCWYQVCTTIERLQNGGQ